MSSGRVIGGYLIYDEIAAGGMGMVHFGRVRGAAGFTRTVAIKRLYPQHVADPDFVAMFVDEALLASRIHHPNVVQTLDVVALDQELFLVFDYVHGASLAELLRAARAAGQAIPRGIVSAVIVDALRGLHAAHEATREGGEPLGLVHRDVSPHNILVGTDGVARLSDFGIAKGAGRRHVTRDGEVKGKLPYMAPEQLLGGEQTRAVDVYGAAVVLWEGLAGRPLFDGSNDAEVIEQVRLGYVEAPSAFDPRVSATLDAITLRGLERDPAKRFSTAREMALALEQSEAPALPSEVGAWVERTVAKSLERRTERLAIIMRHAPDLEASPDGPPSTTRDEGVPRRRGWIVIVALLVFLSALVLVFLLRRAEVAGPKSAPLPGESSVPIATPGPSQSVAELAPSALPSVPSSSGAKSGSLPPRPRPSRDDSCAVPYFVDASGRRIYKRQCL